MKRVAFIITLMAGLLFTSTAFASEYYEVSGDSMKPTLHNGDIIELVSSTYGEGDIVIAETVGAYGYTHKLVIKRVIGNMLIGDNRENTAVFNKQEVRILGKSVKIEQSIKSEILQKVEAAGETYHYTIYNSDTGEYQSRTTTDPSEIPSDRYSSVFTEVSGATYYYSYYYRYYRAYSTTVLNNISSDYYDSTFTAVPGATYYYCTYSNRSYTRQTTTNPSQVPSNLYSYTFTVVPGATYYYSERVGSGRRSYYNTYTTKDPNAIPTSCYASVFTVGLNMTPDIYFSSNAGIKIPLNGSGSISGTAVDSGGNDITLTATVNGIIATQTVHSGNSYTLTWAGAALGAGSWSNITVYASAGPGRTASKVYTGTIKVSPDIVYLPLKHAGSFVNGGAWGSGNKDADRYGDGDSYLQSTPDMLIYDRSTNQLTLNAVGRYGEDGPSSRGCEPYVDVDRYDAEIYVGIFGSGIRFGDVTVTKGIPKTEKWDYVSFTGTWTLPNLSSSIYKNSGGIFVEMTRDYPYRTYSREFYWQFDASKILYNSSVAAPTPPSITVVNGKPFNITLSGITGKFVGTNNQYGIIRGSQSGANVVLSSISGLTGLPSSFTDLLVGSDKIRIRGVSAPLTTATTSFY